MSQPVVQTFLGGLQVPAIWANLAVDGLRNSVVLNCFGCLFQFQHNNDKEVTQCANKTRRNFKWQKEATKVSVQDMWGASECNRMQANQDQANIHGCLIKKPPKSP
eukprot:3406067-Amphidinium_carterae.1